MLKLSEGLKAGKMRRMRTGDLGLIRDLNENAVFRLLMKQAPISRVGIRRSTGLSFPAVTKIVNRLRKREFVREHSVGESSGGRKPTLLSINPKGGYVIGVCLDVIRTTVGLLDLRGGVKKKMDIAMREDLEPETVLQAVTEGIKQLVGEFHAATGFTNKILGVGIACPGEVDYRTGDLVWSANLGWKNVPLKSMINDACGYETYVEDEPKAMAIGEHWFGSAKDTNNLVWIYVSGGLGMAVVIDGAIYRGVGGNPGEFCHVPMVDDGALCSCGNRGCLETMAAEVGTLKRVREAVQGGTQTAIFDLAGGRVEDIKLTHVLQAAREGDGFALIVRGQMVNYIALAISLAAAAYDTRFIVLGGDVIEQGGDELFELINARVADKMPKQRYSELSIRRSIMGEDEGVISAATLVYQELFSSAAVSS